MSFIFKWAGPNSLQFDKQIRAKEFLVEELVVTGEILLKKLRGLLWYSLFPEKKSQIMHTNEGILTFNENAGFKKNGFKKNH